MIARIAILLTLFIAITVNAFTQEMLMGRAYGARGGANAWTPSNSLMPVLWLDSSTLAYTNLQPVTQWKDLSGVSNAIAYTASYDLAPKYTTNDSGGLGAVRFDGDADPQKGDYLYTSRRFLTNQWTVFVVQSAGAQTNSGIVVQHNADASLGRCFMVSGSSVSPYVAPRIFFNNGTSYGLQATNSAFNGSASIIASYADLNRKYTMSVNGTNQDISTAQSIPVLNTTLKIGAAAGNFPNVGSASPYKGDIYSVICYTNSLSDTDLQRVEGYLAWKWGLQGSLPASHPYKSARPTQ